MNWLQKISNAIPPILEGLAEEARKCNSYEEFFRSFAGQIKHGMYWHVTQDPDFTIDPLKGPMDASSMALSNKTTPGALMVTSHLEYWAINYAPWRQYAALIDMSDVPAEGYKQVNRGFGNEFFIEDASKARVIGTFPIKEALRIAEEHHASIPQNDADLRQFYEMAKNSPPAPHPSAEYLAGHESNMTREEWNSVWVDELEEYWENQE